MRVEIQNTLMAGPGGPGEDQPIVFEGKTAVEILNEMKAGSMFTDGLTIPQYVARIRMIVQGQTGTDLVVSDTGPESDEDLALGLLQALERAGFAVVGA